MVDIKTWIKILWYKLDFWFVNLEKSPFFGFWKEEKKQIFFLKINNFQIIDKFAMENKAR